jgi:hypothetical protein
LVVLRFLPSASFKYAASTVLKLFPLRCARCSLRSRVGSACIVRPPAIIRSGSREEPYVRDMSTEIEQAKYLAWTRRNDKAALFCSDDKV